MIQRSVVLSFSILFLIGCKQSDTSILYKTKTATAAGYTYEYVENDPSKTRIYTLDNGLKVYLSVYKDEPRIQTYIPVKAGGKNDPATSTGLAHYLEHMMFKGTSTFGTKDWDTEKVLLDSIENMFEHYRTLTDPDERRDWYAKIDQVSNEASKFAIANEYDNLCTVLGYKGTNAYTTEDRTVYMNDIPSNQLENFLNIESVRFGMIVNRLFHTELEAVYEEKNRSLDNDYWKSAEAMYRNVFQKHPYGTQTVIGTIDHLKNPSITDINAYFEKYYVPNNMAVCLAGDLDPDVTIKLVDQYFGKLESSPIEPLSLAMESPIESPREVEVFGPESEQVNLGFRFKGTSSSDYATLTMVDYMLANSVAGLIDLNLVQKQKVLNASCYVDNMNDYSVHTLYGEPREGQTLEEVRDLLLAQVDIIKEGAFEDWLLEAIVNEFKKNKMQALESNRSRANDMVMAFTNDMDWQDYISRIQQMEAVTKEDIINFTNANYKDNYVAVYKRTGEDPNKQKVEKPSITKVEVDRVNQSDFFKAVKDKQVDNITPVFVDYNNDLQIGSMKSDVPVLYKKNDENSLFRMYYLLETGTNENPMVEMALNYLEYLGTDALSAEDFKKELYKIGASFSVFSNNERVYVILTGLDENMVPAMELFENLLTNPRADEDALKNMISDSHKNRSDAKKNKRTILWSGLSNYAKYGAENPFTNVLSNEELNNMTSNALLDIIKSINQTEHKVMYYGPLEMNELVDILNENHIVPNALKPLPEKKNFARLSNEEPKVFFADYDMVQAEMVLQSRGPKYNSDITPEAQLFNEYFGAGMSSILFQEIREAQGLAYSVFSSYQMGSKIDREDNMFAYIGTQADKQKEALSAMIDLLNNLPESEQKFQNAKKAILNKIETSRITKTSVLFNYLSAQQKGLESDIRQKVYNRVAEMEFDDLKAFHEKYVKDKKYNLAVVGDDEKMNFQALNAFGEVITLSLEELFGYPENVQTVLN